MFGADRAKDVGGRGPLVLRRRRTATALGPTSGELVLLTDPGLVGEPDFYGIGADALLARDRRQAGRKTFLKPSTAPAA